MGGLRDGDRRLHHRVSLHLQVGRHRKIERRCEMKRALLALVSSGLLLNSSGAPPAVRAEEVRNIAPLPIPGGDIIPCPCAGKPSGSLLIHTFSPGPGFDGQDAEPNTITNFNGTFAQVYMGGHATDSAGGPPSCFGAPGCTWDVDVDTRVYQGEYVGANGVHAHGTFALI
jgi:hypothetical protein